METIHQFHVFVLNFDIVDNIKQNDTLISTTLKLQHLHILLHLSIFVYLPRSISNEWEDRLNLERSFLNVELFIIIY